MAKKAKPEANGELQGDEAAELLDLAVETLRGDIRDVVLAEFKAMPKPWQQMDEDEQDRLIRRADDIAGRLIRAAVKEIAHKGFEHLTARVAQFTVKDELKITAEASATVENITKLASHHGDCVLVLANASVFQGERKPAETEVVGSLAMPKNGRADEAALSQVGQGPSRADPPFAAPPA